MSTSDIPAAQKEGKVACWTCLVGVFNTTRSGDFHRPLWTAPGAAGGSRLWAPTQDHSWRDAYVPLPDPQQRALGLHARAPRPRDARLAPLDRYGLPGVSSAIVEGLRALSTCRRGFGVRKREST